MLILFLDDVVVGNVGLLTWLDDSTLEKERPLENIVPLDCAVLLEDDCVDVWDEEEGGQEGAGGSSSDSDSSNLDSVSGW